MKRAIFFTQHEMTKDQEDQILAKLDAGNGGVHVEKTAHQDFDTFRDIVLMTSFPDYPSNGWCAVPQEGLPIVVAPASWLLKLALYESPLRFGLFEKTSHRGDEPSGWRLIIVKCAGTDGAWNEVGGRIC